MTHKTIRLKIAYRHPSEKEHHIFIVDKKDDAYFKLVTGAFLYTLKAKRFKAKGNIGTYSVNRNYADYIPPP